MRVPLPVADGFYRSESLFISHQECVNLYPHILPEDRGLSSQNLFGCPGIEQVLTTGADSTDANRGAKEMKQIPYFVNGQSLYRVNSDGTADTLGTVDGVGRVSMDDNGTQLMIIASGLVASPGYEGYIYDRVAGTFAVISDVDFFASGNPTQVRYIDSYFMCVTDEGKHIISSNNDGTAWNALDFGSAESDPDPTKGIEKLNNKAYIFGSETIEGMINQAIGADYPFRRSGVYADTGTNSPFSIIKFRNRIFFVGAGRGESPAIWEYDGQSEPKKISHEGIDSILQRFTEGEVSLIYSWAYAQKGFYFVGFVLPDTCVVYEVKTGLWHERKSYVTYQDGSEDYTRYRVSSILPAYGKLYAADYVDGRIGYLDIDVYTEYDTTMRRSFSTRPFQNQGKAFRVASLELTVESGVGNDDDEEPLVSLFRSTDARTWSTPLTRKIGRVGEYMKRQIWRKLGRAARFEDFRFDFAGKSKVVAIQLFAEILDSKK